MQKSTEERLAGIESSITRLTKMQGCVFNVLLVMHKISTLISRTEWYMSSLKESVESTSQNMGYAITFMFGTIAMMGITVSMSTLYSATKDFSFMVLCIACFALTVFFLFLAFRYNRRASSQRKTSERELLQAREQAQSDKGEAAALDDALAQALAEWKELVPDDLVSEPKSED